MEERIRDLINIVLSDDEFIRYYNKIHWGNEEQDIKKLEIPKHSFTSHQLTYCSAEELSDNHRTILLGGIPWVWNIQGPYTLFTMLEKMTDTRLRSRIKYVYEKGRSRENRILHWRQYRYRDSGKRKAFEELAKPSKQVVVYDVDPMPLINGCEAGTVTNSGIDITAFRTETGGSSESTDCQPSEDSNDSDDDEDTTDLISTDSLDDHEPQVYNASAHSHYKRKNSLYPHYHNEKASLSREKSRPSSKSFTARSSRFSGKEQLTVLRPVPQSISREEEVRIKNSQQNFVSFNKIGHKISEAIPEIKTEGFFNRFTSKHVNSLVKATKAGRIIKMEKMLIMVKEALTARVVPSHFSEDESVDTRILERWKEYILVARATGNPDAPVRLQMYTSRKIKAQEISGKRPWHCKRQFDLDKTCLVEFYNNLDKSICVVKQDDSLTEEMKTAEIRSKKLRATSYVTPLQIYILRCDNLLSSSRWLIFLRSSIGLASQPHTIDINIPAINLTVNVGFSDKIRHQLAEKSAEEKDVMKILFLEKGYHVLQLPILRYLKLVIREMLINLGYKRQATKWDNANLLMGLCWKYYDRLEWAYGNQMDLLYGSFVLRKSHILEFRKMQTYPRSVNVQDTCERTQERTLYEPAPVEGFLSQNNIMYGETGSKLAHPYFKLSYWFTTHGFLFVVRSAKATPPLPKDDIVDPYGIVKDRAKLEEIIKTLPDKYDTNPYRLDNNGHIDWLNDKMSDEDFRNNDKVAMRSYLRKVSLILKADKCIDLTKCQDIRRFDTSGKYDKTMKVWNDANNIVWASDQAVEATRSSIIEIVLSKSESKLLLAPNPKICQEWLNNLQSISRYWKERKCQDDQMLWDTKFRNHETFNINEIQEKHISASAPKWMTELSETNALIYNVSSHTMSRPIVHQGILYHKSRKHSVFDKKLMVLIPGFIVMYHCFDRSLTGFATNSTEYTHFLTLPIEKCYLYSGVLTEQELLARDKGFNNLNPGSHSLSRVYEDGWKSMDEESSRTFVIWFPSKKLMLNPSEQFDDAEKDSKVKFVDKLGVAGRSMTFMCRSRQERDLWMVKLYDELERSKIL